MNCTNHPETEAQGMCAYCGKPFCKDCLVEVKGRMYCKEDLGNVLDEAKQSASSQPTIQITNSNESTNTNMNANSGMYGPRKSKMTALILCLLGFIGFSGIHRMYVGKVGSGVIYFFTGGLCVIGTIIDLISILSGGFRDSYGQPLV
ncbi:MAG: NINE protein [Clostridiales bacterium]|nr:NINE protein [Clostridiales bacterium]